MKTRLPTEVLAKARQLRHNPTRAEERLWDSLQRRQMCGTKFRRQHPIGPYIVDFYSHEARLVIEIDGGQHGLESQVPYDSQRTCEIERQGVRVIRFWNSQVLNETEEVLEQIRHVLES